MKLLYKLYETSSSHSEIICNIKLFSQLPINFVITKNVIICNTTFFPCFSHIPFNIYILFFSKSRCTSLYPNLTFSSHKKTNFTTVTLCHAWNWIYQWRPKVIMKIFVLPRDPVKFVQSFKRSWATLSPSQISDLSATPKTIYLLM